MMHRALATITHTRPGGTQIAKHTYGYDPLGRISSWKREATLANPTGSTRSYEWEMGYDYASQLTRVIEKTLTGTLAGVHAFGYDPAGNMTSMQKSGGSPNAVIVTARAHNSLNQITSLSGGGETLVRGTLDEPGSASVGKAGTPLVPARMTAGNTFEKELNLTTGQNDIAVRAEDASGNISNYSFRTDIVPVTQRNFSYDADGNLLSDGIRSYEWDCLNRLTKVIWNSTKYTRFFYNALGQRVVIGEVEGGAYTDLKFLAWDGIALLSVRKGTAAYGYSGAQYDRRFFAQGEQKLTQSGSSGNITVSATYHYTRDHLGSVREVVQSNGTLVARYDYDPYGKRLTQYEATAYGTCQFGFTGHLTLTSPIPGGSEVVLTHFRAYHPELGRWLSPDPLGEAGGINLYGYVGNEPVGAIDLLGLVGSGVIPTGNGWVNVWTGERGTYTGTPKVGGFFDAFLQYVFGVGSHTEPRGLTHDMRCKVSKALRAELDTSTPTNMNWRSAADLDLDIGLTFGNFRYTKDGDQVTLQDHYAFPHSQSDWSGGTSHQNAGTWLFFGSINDLFNLEHDYPIYDKWDMGDYLNVKSCP